jgi:hypothetical protein
MQPYLGFWFIEDERKEDSTREVITLWDVLGDLGGLMEIIMVTCALIVGTVQEFMYDSNLIRKIFLTEPTNNDPDEYDKKKQKKNTIDTEQGLTGGRASQASSRF